MERLEGSACLKYWSSALSEAEDVVSLILCSLFLIMLGSFAGSMRWHEVVLPDGYDAASHV